MKKRRLKNRLHGFTFMEIVVTLVVLSGILTTVVAVMIKSSESMLELQACDLAFKTARENMEQLLAKTKVEEQIDFGYLESNPDIEWETLVEPFTEPITNRMWIQAVCTASYTDNEGERQEIRLTSWLTNLTKKQIEQIRQQQLLEQEWLEELNENPFGEGAEGLLKYAISLANQEEYEEALDVLDEIIYQYPDSNEADKAAMLMNKWQEQLEKEYSDPNRITGF